MNFDINYPEPESSKKIPDSIVLFEGNSKARSNGWVENNRDLIIESATKNTAVLFRGFGLTTVEDFERFVSTLHPELYGGYGDLPKEVGSRIIYKSTPYPKNKMILYHNESSHTHTWPRWQSFFCLTAASRGGATPLVDCRKVYQLLPPSIRDRFEKQGLLYVRTFTKHLDVSWQDFFHSDSRLEVERLCSQFHISHRWLENDGLQTRTRCPAVISHPATGEKSFFNQLQLHHSFFLDARIRNTLVKLVGKEFLPRNVFYGDGSPIEDGVVEQINELYQQCAVRFDWRSGDMLMLDNMLTAHARDPFEGERRIAVAMSEMVDTSSISDRAIASEMDPR